MSYLATPASADTGELARALAELPGCTVLPSDGREVLVLVTDTPDDAAEASLVERLRALPSLEALVLVSAFSADARESTCSPSTAAPSSSSSPRPPR